MTLASWITITRFGFIPFIYLQLVSGAPQGVPGALILLLLAGFTDMLDGWVARARQEVSELGKALDPLADKLVIIFTLLALVIGWHLPVWLVIVYLAKEIIQIMAGLLLFRKDRRLIPANWWGKAGTVGFFAGFGTFFWNRSLGIIIFWIAVGLSCYAFYTYLQIYLQKKNEV